MGPPHSTMGLGRTHGSAVKFNSIVSVSRSITSGEPNVDAKESAFEESNEKAGCENVKASQKD